MKGRPMKLKFYKKNFINQRTVQLVLPINSPLKLAFTDTKPDFYYQDSDKGWLADGYLVDVNTIVWFGNKNVAEISPSKELQKTYGDQMCIAKIDWERAAILTAFIKAALDEYTESIKNFSNS